MTLFLSAVQPQGDPVALIIVLVLALWITGMALRKHLTRQKVSRNPPTVTPPVSEPPNTRAPGSAGKLKLHNVDPKTAAMIMAITAYHMNRPLDELRFLSIKEIEP